jgi:DNA-directed RNA polymerase specialized sigma24 family protein
MTTREARERLERLRLALIGWPAVSGDVQRFVERLHPRCRAVVLEVLVKERSIAGAAHAVRRTERTVHRDLEAAAARYEREFPELVSDMSDMSDMSHRLG